jgi:hypothetical protein
LIDALASFIESGEFFDWVLLGVALELVTLVAWRGRAVLKDLLPNLIAGAALMVSVKLAITDAPWQWLALALAIALLAHGIDLAQRLHSEK